MCSGRSGLSSWTMTAPSGLGFEEVSFHESVAMVPRLALMDSAGSVLASASLNYFDEPRLEMRTLQHGSSGLPWSADHSLVLEVDDRKAHLVTQGAHPRIELQDRNGVTRVLADLSGGDEGQEPNVTISDSRGRPRLEIALDEVERSIAAPVGDDYETASWFEYSLKVRMLDVEGNVTWETPNEEEDDED